jgi:hypothetical protein
MFPTGTAGVALLILRLSASASLLAHATELPNFAGSFTLLVISASALCLGFVTPYVSAVSCLMQLAAVGKPGNHLAVPIIISVANTAALGILGPGAYSLDAKIFGRRIVRFSSYDKSKSS